MAHTIRVFLASPGDVADERALALKVLERLPYDAFVRGKVTIEVVAWDKPGAGTPMLATITPQEAIANGLPRPSECDVIVAVFWSRMGTLLPEDWVKPLALRYLSGTEFEALDARFLSGTEWEYFDALQAADSTGKPRILVYRRTEKQVLDQDDPSFDAKREQWKLVKTFFDAFRNPDGSLRRGYNEYATPTAFEQDLEHHVRDVLKALLEAPASPDAAGDLGKPPIAEPQLWNGSPFPGLRSFTEQDWPIYFGRGRETDGLIRKLADPSNRFVAIVAIALRATLDRRGMAPREVAAELHSNVRALDQWVVLALEEKPEWAQLLLFVDQFEELFTLVAPHYRDALVELLARAMVLDRVRTVVTVRADFYHRCLEWPALRTQFESIQFEKSHYPLMAPGLGQLHEMIVRPAERAGLSFEEGLPERILNDTGIEPGALPLMAYALSELYQTRTAEGCLNHAACLRGLRGRWGRHRQARGRRLPACLPAFRRSWAMSFGTSSKSMSAVWRPGGAPCCSGSPPRLRRRPWSAP